MKYLVLIIILITLLYFSFSSSSSSKEFFYDPDASTIDLRDEGDIITIDWNSGFNE